MSHSAPHTPTEGDHYEKTDVNVTWIVASVVVCTIAVVVSVILCDFYFDYYKDKLHQEMVVDRGFRLSGEVKETGAATLNSAASEGDAKRIPIDQAIRAVSEEAK